MKNWVLDDFDYFLPENRIAQAPLSNRSASRLLVLSAERHLEDCKFDEILNFLRPNDLLVFNDTRVLHARFHGYKESGGKVEVLIERTVDNHQALAMIRASKTPKLGSRLILSNGAFPVVVVAREGEFFRLQFPLEHNMLELIEAHGQLPLPPYIERKPEEADENRYQTVFARHPGSVAAPTAGLHFDEPLLSAIKAKGIDLAWVTLHVGAGTFQPVRVQNLDMHRMHRERYHIPQETVEKITATQQKGGRVIAVGTTSLRTLEAAAQNGPLSSGRGEAELFILPGYRFRVVDGLITNFHLPKSTLLMLVCALAGKAKIEEAYKHAIENGYRFFSYGDAMFITPECRDLAQSG